MNLTRGAGLLENFLAKKRSKMANILIPQRLRSGRIIDIGCGQFPHFLVNSNFREKYCIETSSTPNPIEGINLLKINIEETKTPFNNNFFDIVVMLAVIEHLEPTKIVSILREIRRILKPGGRFILTTPCPWSDKLLRFMALIRLVSSTEINEHKAVYDRDLLFDCLKKAGFEKNKMKFGYFEFFLNGWVYVDK